MTAPIPRVLTYGCFDQFHQGHVQFLRRVAQLGGELIVGCATDELAEFIGLPCVNPYPMRRRMLECCRYVSRVIPETDVDQKRRDILHYNATTLAMGLEYAGLFDNLADVIQLQYIARSNLPEIRWKKAQM